MVGGEQQILDVIIRVIIAAKVAEVTCIHRIVAAQAVSVDIIDPAAGTAEEHDVAIGKVDIEVIPIEALAGPN